MALLALPGATEAQEQEYESPAASTFNVTSASPAALEHFRAGMWEWDNIDQAAAAEHFEAALDVDPSFGAARVFHAASAGGMSAEERAEQIAVGMIDMARGTTVEQLLALALKEAVSGNNATAAMLVKAASELAPDAPHLAYRHAIWSGGGLKAMKDVTHRFPDFAPAWNIIAYGLYDEGMTDEAVEAVTKYVELAPDHPNPHDSYAEIMQWEGETETALAHYRKAVELRPSYVAGYTGIAEAEWLMGNRNEARAALEQAAMHQTTEAAKLNTKRAIAASYMMEGKRKEADAMFSEVAASAEAGGYDWIARNAHYQAAANDAINGKGESVTAHLAKAAELGGEGTSGQYIWGASVYALAGDLETARTMLTSLKKMESASDSDGTRVAAAHVLIEEGDIEGAMSILKEMDETNTMARALMARAYKAMKEGDKAKKLQASVVADPTMNFYNPGQTMAAAQVRKM